MFRKYSIFPIVATLFLVLVSTVTVVAKEDKDKGKASWERAPLELEVVLQTEYLDGNIEEQIKKQTVWSLQDFWAGYEDWKVINQEEGKVVFRKKVDDLSPVVKDNGYFGIDDNNILSIFNGKPSNDDVIKAFYQIDVGKLESHRVDELKAGIKIDKKSTYESVIKTFKEFASSEPVND